MSSESVYQVACSWVGMGSFHTHLFGVVYVTCGDFYDVSEKGTASVLQTLCQSWEKCHGDPHNDSTSLWGPKLAKAWVLHRCFNSMPSSRPVAHQLTMTNTGRPRSCTTPELLHEFKSSSIRNDVRPFTTLLRRWELVMGHDNRFWWKNWACTVSQDPDSWPEAAAHQHLHSTSSARLQWWNLLVQGHHWWWELRLRLQTCVKATILPVEKPHVTKVKKGQTGEKQC